MRLKAIVNAAPTQLAKPPPLIQRIAVIALTLPTTRKTIYVQPEDIIPENNSAMEDQSLPTLSHAHR